MLEGTRSFDSTVKFAFPEYTINEVLPPELIQTIIFPHLSQENAQAAAQTCKSWYSLTKVNLAVKCLTEVDEFIKFLIDNLDPKFEKQRAGLLLIETKKIIEAQSRIDVFLSVYELKDRILNILKELDREALRDLTCLTLGNLPPFFAEFAHEARLYKKLDVLEMHDEDTCREGLVEVAKSFATLGNLKKGLEVAQKIDKRSVRDQTLRTIFRQQVTRGNFEKAAVVLEKISEEGKQDEEDRKDMAIFELLRTSDFSLATKKINKRLFKERKDPLLTRDDFFLGMTVHLVKSNDVKKALMCAKELSGSYEIELALEFLYPLLKEDGEIEIVLKMVKAVLEDTVRDHIYAKFYKDLIEKSNFEWARKVAQELTSDKSEYALSYISIMELAKEGSIREALIAINRINVQRQNQVIFDIFLIALLQNKFQEANETANAISDAAIRHIAFDTLSWFEKGASSSHN